MDEYIVQGMDDKEMDDQIGKGKEGYMDEYIV